MLCVSGGFLFFVCAPVSASAATLYWVGNDGDVTSTASNWKTTDPAACGSGNASAAPSSSDTMVFDADCDNSATIDSTMSVTTVTVSSGYAGTVLLKAALTTSTFSQAAGTIRLNGQAFTVSSTFTISGGTFMAGTGSVVLSGGSATIDINSTQTLYDLTINSTGTKTIAASDSISMSGALTLTDGLVSQATIPTAGTLRAKGNVTQASTFDGGTARLVFDGTSSQTFIGNATRTAGLLPIVKIDKAGSALTLSGTLRTANNWGYSGGTLNFTNSTVVFGDASLVVAGSHNLSNVIFDPNSATARTYTIKQGTTLTVLGTLTMDNSSTSVMTFNTGIISAQGNIVQGDAINHTGTANLFINGTGSQLFSGYASNSTGGLVPISINKSSGTLTLSGTIRTIKNWGYSGGTINAGTSTVVFGATLSIAGSHALYNVRFDGYKTAGTYTITTPTILTVSGALTLDQSGDLGIITINTGKIYARGNINLPDSTVNHTGTANVVIDGTANQTMSGTASNSTGGFLPLSINKASGVLTLSGTIRTIKNWGYSGGTLDAGTSTVVFGATLSIAGSHALYNVRFDGYKTAGTYTITAPTTLTANGSLTFDQGGDSNLITINTGKIHAKGNVNQQDTLLHVGSANLFINGTGSQLFTGRASQSVGSILDITIDKSGGGTLTLSGTIRTGHNWNFSGGTLNPGASTLVLGKPSITTIRVAGSHSLYNLTFDTNDASQRQFTINTATTVTVLNDLTLDNTGAGSFGIQSGTISVKGNVYNRDAINHSGSATIAFTGTGNQLFSGVGTAKLGGMPIVVINKSSGTLTLSGTIRGGWDWTYRAGTIDASTNQSTVVFAGSTNAGSNLQTISGSMTLYNIVFTGAFVHTIGSGTTVTASNLLTLSDGSIRTGTASTLNDLSYASYFDGGNGGVTIDGSATRTIALTASGSLPNMKVTGANVTVTSPGSSTVNILGDYKQTAGTFTGGAGKVFVLGNFTLAGGTFTAPGTLDVGGSFTYTSGTFDPNGGTVQMSGAYGVITPPSSFYNLTLADDEHIIGYWRLDDGTGTTIADVSPNGRSGTWSGPLGTATPQWTASSGSGALTNTGALQFDGTDDTVALGTFSHVRTASAWFKLPDWNNDENILAWSVVEMLLQISTGTVTAYFNGSGMFPSNPVNFGEWHHIAMTYDGIFARVFLDGSEIRSLRTTEDTASYALTLSQALGPVHGTIDDARAYDRALSPTEVKGLYDNFNKTHLLAGDLNVDNTLTMNTSVLDPSNNCYDVDYGTLSSTGSLILPCSVSSSSSSSSSSSVSSSNTSQQPTGGGGGRRNPGAVTGGGQTSGSPSVSSVSSSSESSSSVGCQTEFTDVPSTSWFACYIANIFKKGIVSGYKDEEGNSLNLFGPANPITYAELAKIALLGSGNQVSETSEVPKNISAQDMWAAPFIALAEKLHFSVFSPSLEVNQPASRGAVILTMLQAFHVTIQKDLPNTFTDLAPSDPYKSAILTAAALGWINGDMDANGNRLGTVRSQDSINRAEVAKILTKARGEE